MTESELTNELKKKYIDPEIAVSITFYSDSVYYDLETIPLKVNSYLVDLTGVEQETQSEEKITKWELVPIDSVSKVKSEDGKQN